MTRLAFVQDIESLEQSIEARERLYRAAKLDAVAINHAEEAVYNRRLRLAQHMTPLFQVYDAAMAYGCQYITSEHGHEVDLDTHKSLIQAVRGALNG